MATPFTLQQLKTAARSKFNNLKSVNDCDMQIYHIFELREGLQSLRENCTIFIKSRFMGGTKEGLKSYSSVKPNLITNTSASGNYSNLNLNQNSICVVSTPVQSCSKSSNNGIQHCGKKDSNFLTTFSSKSKVEKDKKKCWMNEGSNTTNSSTLSLHISAYENSNEAYAFNSFGDFGIISKSIKIQQICDVFNHNSFEFPRQQKDEVSEPEMSHFKASQILRNPNEASIILQQEAFPPPDSLPAEIKIDEPIFSQIHGTNFTEDELFKLLLEMDMDDNFLILSKYVLELDQSKQKYISDTLSEKNDDAAKNSCIDELADNLAGINLAEKNDDAAENSCIDELADNLAGINLESPDSFVAEVARNGSPQYIYDFDGLNDDGEISIINDSTASDSANNENITESAVGNNNDNLDGNEEQIYYPKRVEKNLTSQDLLKIALNIESRPDCESVFPPLKLSDKEGYYLTVVSAETLKNIGDIFSTDMPSPWNSKTSRAKQYFITYEVENEDVVKYERVKAADKDNFATYCFEYQARHPIFTKLTKKIVAILQPHNKKPIEGTKVAIFYHLEEDCADIYECCDKESFTPRLGPSNSAAIKALTKTKTPRNAVMSHNQTNSIVSGLYPAVTEKQAQNVAGHDIHREAITNKGVKAKINFDTIHKLAQNQQFVLEYGTSGGDMNIFCACKASLGMMRASTVTIHVVHKLVNQVEEALKLPSDERYAKLNEIVSSPAYQELKDTGIALIDTTFNLCCLYLTILMFSSPHLLRDGRPASFTGCYFLSSKKDATTYESMANYIDKWVGACDKIFRALITDADAALDSFLKSKIFGPGCIKLQCCVHLKQNIEDLCDTDAASIITDIFGTVIGEVRYKGLLDELTYPEFLQKLEYLITLPYWISNVRLIEWFSKGFRKQKLFQRYGLVGRIKAGLGCDESQTNTIENENMNLKQGIDDNTPVQNLFKKLEKRSHSQITAAAMAFVQGFPIYLRNKSNFIGTEKWRRLDVDHKKKLFLTVGLCHTDVIEGFHLAPTTFPSKLSPNLSELDRQNMITVALNYEVLQSATEGTFIVMTATNPVTVIVKEKPQCSCKYRERHRLICEHMLAVHYKHPSMEVIKKLEAQVDKESIVEKHERASGINSGGKPGTSRRRAPASTRNSRKTVNRVRDCESATNNTSITILNRLGTPSSEPNVAPISTYNASKQLDCQPNAIPPRPDTFHKPTAEALRNYKMAYNITSGELWFNANSFNLKYTNNVARAYTRDCCQCRMNISKTQKIVFTHLEKYEYVMKTTGQVRQGYGERIICAKYDCFISRYPYAQQDCIISEVSPELTEETLSNIFAP
uniref:SWIM-type domain-containing protein n=1 Tax=Panagrolaimus davidi TaxID=227884 RepID=A0A914QY15_9BILA